MCRIHIGLVICCFANLSAHSIGEQPKDSPSAREVIQRAVAAQGGKDVLAKFAAYSYRKDTILYEDEKLKVRTEAIFQSPSQYVATSKFTSGTSLVQWVNNDHAWTKIDSERVEELSGKALKYERFKAHIAYVDLLYPLLERDSGFQLTKIGESALDGRNVVAIRVTKEDTSRGQGVGSPGRVGRSGFGPWFLSVRRTNRQRSFVAFCPRRDC